ncbi:MAG TPA: diaminopimelate epimerase [Gammaproteobacteria bacterium]|nr:diaminopimelate epimerase [Gammaproteobacteria bacterium]
MLLEFTKMQGLGNDFVVIDAVAAPVELSGERLRRLADRRFGVGCDQVLMLERAPAGSQADFRYRIFNADGGEVEQCGNGARCMARFARERGYLRGPRAVFDTAGGLIRLRIERDGRVRADMGVPRLEPGEIPFEAPRREATYALAVDGERRTIAALSLGNPHAVLQVPDVDRAPVAELGSRIERHPRFPRRVNVGFMQVAGRNRIRLRVYERGVGETLACGTGACAAAVAGRLQGLLDARVTVELRGGELTVEWEGEGKPVSMTGPGEVVFTGEIEL